MDKKITAKGGYCEMSVLIVFLAVLVNAVGLIVPEIAGSFHIFEFFGQELFGASLLLIGYCFEAGNEVPFGAVSTVLVTTDVQFAEVEELDFAAEPLWCLVVCHTYLATFKSAFQEFNCLGNVFMASDVDRFALIEAFRLDVQYRHCAVACCTAG